MVHSNLATQRMKGLKQMRRLKDTRLDRNFGKETHMYLPDANCILEEYEDIKSGLS